MTKEINRKKNLKGVVVNESVWMRRDKSKVLTRESERGARGIIGRGNETASQMNQVKTKKNARVR